MKKVILLVICLIFLCASAMSLFIVRDVKTVACACSNCTGTPRQPTQGNPPSNPSVNPGGGSAITAGVQLWYSDAPPDENRRGMLLNYTQGTDTFIRFHGDFGAYVNTTGFLTFQFMDTVAGEAASDRITDMFFGVVRLGADSVEGDASWEGDEDVGIPPMESIDYDGNPVFSWEYNAGTGRRSVGTYRITLGFAQNNPLFEHEVTDRCIEPHEHDANCEQDCEIDYDVVCSDCRTIDEHADCDDDECEVCIPPPQMFVFYSVARSYDFTHHSARDMMPNFGATFTSGDRTFDETARLAFNTRFETRVRVDHRFYWNLNDVVYTVTCDFLSVSNDGTHMILRVEDNGRERQTFSFTLTFDFWHIDAQGNLTRELGRTETVVLTMGFFSRGRQFTVWDVVIGAAILAALGGAAVLMTRMSRDVGNSQSM